MLVGESKEHVWEVMAKFIPQLNHLQQTDETTTSATPVDLSLATMTIQEERNIIIL